MILPDFKLTTLVNEYSTESGLDSFSNCIDQAHFKNYPNKVEYKFSNRGFRDQEWPLSVEELKNCIWCFGDSFTLGLGSPLTHTWVNQLEIKTGIRCINVSMDGASNAWIARKVIKVLDEISPHKIVIHWSYITRAEHPDSTLTDEKRRQHFDLNFDNTPLLVKNFLNLVDIVEQHKNQTQILHSVIPGWSTLNYYYGVLHGTRIDKLWDKLKGSSWPERFPVSLETYESIPKSVRCEIDKDIEQVFLNYYKFYKILNDALSTRCFVPEFEIVDYARDGHHYDIKTADHFSNKLIELFKIDSSAAAAVDN